MEYFDLDMKPVLLSDDTILKSIIELVKNAIEQYKDQAYFQNLVVDYDKNTCTLEIKDEGSGIKLTDFVEHLANTQDWMTHGLRNALSMFVAHHVNTMIQSNYGTFTPVVQNKQGISEQIPSIFIAYEKTPTSNNKWTNLKDIDDNKDKTHGTTITLSPISYEMVAKLKWWFCFLQSWKEVMKTPFGMLLVANQGTVNNFFLDGENMTFNDGTNHKDLLKLTFSYDCNSASFDPELFANGSLGDYWDKCISTILEHLNDEDKPMVYEQLLNNHDSAEWSSALIRKVVVEYYAKLNPNKYLVGVWKNEDENFVNYANDENKVIIWVEQPRELQALSDCKIMSVSEFGNRYLLKHSPTQYPIVKLGKTQKENWEFANKFLNYLIANYPAIKDALNANDLTNFNLALVDKFEGQPVTYFAAQNLILIDYHLLDKHYWLESILDAIPNELAGIDDYDELIDNLNSAFLNFLISQLNKTRMKN